MNGMQAGPLSCEELVEKYAKVIYRIAYARLGNVPDAEDITQEVLLKYLKANKTFQDEDHRRMWLIRVTVNAVNSLAKSAYRRHAVSLEDATELSVTDPEPSFVKEALERLPEKYRIPIHLFYYEELSIGQIAGILGCAEGTVKSLLSRGRDKLREELKGEEYDG